MNPRFPRRGRSVCLALLPMLAIACGESAVQVSTTTTASVDRVVPTSSLPPERTTTVVEQAATY